MLGQCVANPDSLPRGESTERLLLARLTRKDETAWGEVFNAHRDRIFSYCLRMVRNREEAEDISQEVFLRAVRAVGNFRGDASIKTWLHQIAHNLCLTRLAATKKGMQYAADGSLNEVASEGSDADRPSAAIQLRAALELAIGELEPVFREAILLREVEDQSYDEIARVTGTSVSTVKTRIYRARVKLRRRLAEFR